MDQSVFELRKQFSEIMEGDAEFIPLLSQEEEDIMNAENVPEILPVLPLRNMVLFPGVVIPITVGREKSIRLIKDAYKGNRTIGVVVQRDGTIEDPVSKDIYNVGTVAQIIRLLQMPDGSTSVIIQGKKRFRINEIIQEDPYFKAKVTSFEISSKPSKSKEFNALISSIKDLAIQIIKLSPNIPSDATFAIRNIESPVFLVNFVASNLNIDIAEKQDLLETPILTERANKVLTHLSKEIQILELKNQIQDKVKVDIDKQQRDYFLSQQLKTIQEELGLSPNEQHILELQEKAAKKKWPKEIKEIFQKELLKLQRMNPMAAEHSIQTNYLEVIVELPWDEHTNDNFDLGNAAKVLNEDHYGLEKVKERIIEYLAVLKLRKDIKSPILCLVGPPGVGKTSLGKSIARAVGRQYVRMSLGGLRDEAEIRGHRRTYIGAMPGRIIQSIRKAKSSNPVFVLDEIDKVMGMNINGDPSAALLEVLDPEQNGTFYDNFLEITYDLSKVMFIATANTLSTIHPALVDRMEVIDISGYLLEEKIEIAKRHLIPKQQKEHGLKKTQVSFADKIIEKIIEEYTRESGVRYLEKLIARMIRSNARFIVQGEKYNSKFTEKDLLRVLGPEPYQKEKDMQIMIPGIATGLAWTPVGGEILFIESSLSKGKGVLTLTGNLGDVMKESAAIAFEYLKSHADILNITEEQLGEKNVHIHVPEGATPKDGPSAGITMFTALVSVFTGRKVKSLLAMTGEITLRGKVLPVGGIKEKILAARRAKVKDIILSNENKKDILEIKEDYLTGITFHYVNNMLEVIDLALEKAKPAKSK